MAFWYLGKIRYQKEVQGGTPADVKLTTVNEAFVLDAVSFTEAEARLYEVIARNTPDFSITNISRMKLAEVFEFEEGEKWYKIKVAYITYDEKAKKEKKVPHLMLVNAETVMEAYNRIEERLGALEDYEITDINLTNILEVYPYEAENKMLKNLKPLSEILVEQEA